MKLISEYINSPLEVLIEKANGKKSMHIEGVFMQAETKNRNGRVYEKRILESAVKKYAV